MKRMFLITIMMSTLVCIMMFRFGIRLGVSLEPPKTLWQKTYGGLDHDCAYSLVQTEDGGFALAGATKSFGAGNTDFYLVKIDADGNMMWNKTYGETGADEAHSMVQTKDGGYALAGVIDYYLPDGGDFWLVKADANGNQTWNKTYGGGSDDFAYSVVQTVDDGYAIAGYTSSFGVEGRDFWLVKTDSNGEMQWSKPYGGFSDDQARCVIQTGDGGYAILGFSDSFGAGSDDVWLVKTDVNGTMCWNMTYGGIKRDCAESVIQTADGGYALAGIANFTTDSPSIKGDAWLIKTDAIGNMMWDRTFGGDNSDDVRSPVRTEDGGYAIVGATNSFGSGDWDGWLIKTDANGDMQWNETYGKDDEDWVYSVVQTNDGEYVMGGYTKSYGAGDPDFWLIKTAPPSAVGGIQVPVNKIELMAPTAGLVSLAAIATASTAYLRQRKRK